MKFNDITVSEASWEELEKESIGGYHNASAYCLMYIDAKKFDSLLGMYVHECSLLNAVCAQVYSE